MICGECWPKHRVCKQFFYLLLHFMTALVLYLVAWIFGHAKYFHESHVAIIHNLKLLEVKSKTEFSIELHAKPFFRLFWSPNTDVFEDLYGRLVLLSPVARPSLDLK